MTISSFDESPVENAGIDQTWIENVMKGAMSATKAIIKADGQQGGSKEKEVGEKIHQRKRIDQ